MPIQPCVSKKKRGKKYGESGHCYTGPDAEKRAVIQMKAIKASQYGARRFKQYHDLPNNV